MTPATTVAPAHVATYAGAPGPTCPASRTAAYGLTPGTTREAAHAPRAASELI